MKETPKLHELAPAPPPQLRNSDAIGGVSASSGAPPCLVQPNIDAESTMAIAGNSDTHPELEMAQDFLPPKSDPPLLIGGLLQQTPNKDIHISLTGAGIDYLTVTVPEITAEVLISKTGDDEPGTAGRGFRESEKRMCMGGFCWRRWNPITSSKRWGTEYETWEFAGVTAFDPARYLLDHPSKPSRIDIAFDYQVPSDFYPIELEALIQDHVESRGAKIWYAGERKKQTIYVGSRKSDRQIRIYRRDEKNPLLAAEGHHILRVELTLKREPAEAIWELMRQGGTNGQPQAAAHILEMIGYAPCDEVAEIPELLRSDEDTEAVQMLLQFVTQNAVMLKACSVCDIDLANLATTKIDRSRNRMNQSRLAQKVQVMGLIDPDHLQEQVKHLLGDSSAGL